MNDFRLRHPEPRAKLVRRSGMSSHHAVEGDSDVWLTPPAIICELGPFDLDPCAAPDPRPWPTAARHIALPDDGLEFDWAGRVWLNPPYGQKIGRWMERMAQHGKGLALTFARTETEWWQDYVWPFATAVLFVRSRITFHLPDGTAGEYTGGAPSALIAYNATEAINLARCSIRGALVRPEVVR